jgi:hypothetical protein
LANTTQQAQAINDRQLSGRDDQVRQLFLQPLHGLAAIGADLELGLGTNPQHQIAECFANPRISFCDQNSWYGGHVYNTHQESPTSLHAP